jgi:predicted choloylglycine hydrolase
VLRYVLEFSKTTADAVEVLGRVPSHMAYTIGLVDATGAYATVHVSPDRPVEVLDRRVSTNHQNDVEWPEHAELTGSLDRERFLQECIDDPAEGADAFIRRFLRPPVMSTDYGRAFGTLYTAIYWPRRGEAEFRWPNRSWHQSFELFVEGVSVVDFSKGATA